jgi:hypothetical protein
MAHCYKIDLVLNPVVCAELEMVIHTSTAASDPFMQISVQISFEAVQCHICL